MYVKDLTITNFRCFENEKIEQFNIPDGTTPASGLNILIGENGSGKTTVLESINLLTQSSYTTNNTLDISDFKDIANEISVTYTSSGTFKCKMPPIFKDCFFEANGIEFSAKARERKSPGKLLSTPFQISSYFRNITPNYMNSKGADSGNEVADYFRSFSSENIDGDELNIFYFDKNRTRQLTQGNYKTTFERICDDLNWKFVKTINTDATKRQALIDGLGGDYFQQAKDASQSSAGKKVGEDLADFLDDEKYKNLKVDIINYLQPFSSGLLALREDDSLQQIMSNELGSGVEMIIALLMLKNIANASKGHIVYLIDEPEAHLHPKAQKELLKLLMEESKDKQIFVSTHSPYIFKDAIPSKAGLYIFKRDENDIVKIDNAHDKSFGHFPWSPSWGEVNFTAYDLPTVELHNELYGYIQEQTGNHTIANLETYLVSKGITQGKKWIRLEKGSPLPAEDSTLFTYIRNRIHHPENNHNADFSEEELRQSISEMKTLIENGL